MRIHVSLASDIIIEIRFSAVAKAQSRMSTSISHTGAGKTTPILFKCCKNALETTPVVHPAGSCTWPLSGKVVDSRKRLRVARLHPTQPDGMLLPQSGFKMTRPQFQSLSIIMMHLNFTAPSSCRKQDNVCSCWTIYLKHNWVLPGTSAEVSDSTLLPEAVKVAFGNQTEKQRESVFGHFGSRKWTK